VRDELEINHLSTAHAAMNGPFHVSNSRAMWASSSVHAHGRHRVQRGFVTVLKTLLVRNLGHRFRAFLTGLGVNPRFSERTATGLRSRPRSRRGVIGPRPALAVSSSPMLAPRS